MKAPTRTAKDVAIRRSTPGRPLQGWEPYLWATPPWLVQNGKRKRKGANLESPQEVPPNAEMLSTDLAPPAHWTLVGIPVRPEQIGVERLTTCLGRWTST